LLFIGRHQYSLFCRDIFIHIARFTRMFHISSIHADAWLPDCQSARETKSISIFIWRSVFIRRYFNFRQFQQNFEKFTLNLCGNFIFFLLWIREYVSIFFLFFSLVTKRRVLWNIGSKCLIVIIKILCSCDWRDIALKCIKIWFVFQEISDEKKPSHRYNLTFFFGTNNSVFTVLDNGLFLNISSIQYSYPRHNNTN
jgi:hypothetical protein